MSIRRVMASGTAPRPVVQGLRSWAKQEDTQTMDQTTVNTLREQLLEDRAQHMEFLDEHGAEPYGEEVRHLNIGNDGFADSAQATEERSELLGQIEVSRQRIHQIDEALQRMDAGNYGICVDCGEQIPAARLEVRPLSVRCVRCAEKAS